MTDTTSRRRTLVVVAHPDDESFGCGSILAHAAAEGHETAVLCATRGEAGESRLPTADLAGMREAELRAAATILGVGSVIVLDHADSGMDGLPAEGALVAVDPAVLVAELRAVIDDLRPDVVVTLDASDGHRDHVAVRDATLAAVDTSTHEVSATYLSCLARSSMARWADHMRASGGGDAYLAMAELGTPDEDITLVVDVEALLPVRWAAIRAHASQASPYDDLAPELQHEFLAADRLRLVRGRDPRSPGFHAVDAHPEGSLLLTAMDETAEWAATRTLRAWERTQLALRPGQRLLDVGCGLGDAALALGVDLGADGEVVGVDGSGRMVAEARARARAARSNCPTRFAVGDALALDEPDDAFDAVRSERMLQWVEDPARAVLEMARVVRPGGRVCLIDSDWSTFALTFGEPDLEALVREVWCVEDARPSFIGGRLAELAEAAGLRPIARTEATKVWSDWDPDATPRLDGWVPLSDLADDLVAAGALPPGERSSFLTEVEDAARAGRFEMRLTMYAVAAIA